MYQVPCPITETDWPVLPNGLYFTFTLDLDRRWEDRSADEATFNNLVISR
jgi:hypothetical protein